MTAAPFFQIVQDWLDAVGDAMLKAQNATDMYRRAHDAQMTGDGLLIGLYSTRILRGTVLPVVPVFNSMAALRRDGTRWKAIAMEPGVQNRQWSFDFPRVAEPADPGSRDASPPDEAD